MVVTSILMNCGKSQESAERVIEICNNTFMLEVCFSFLLTMY